MNVVDTFPEKMEAFLKWFIRYPAFVKKAGILVTRDKSIVTITSGHCVINFKFKNEYAAVNTVTAEFINLNDSSVYKEKTVRAMCDWEVVRFLKDNLSKNNSLVGKNPLAYFSLPEALLNSYEEIPFSENDYRIGKGWRHKKTDSEVFVYVYSYNMSWVHVEFFSGKRFAERPGHYTRGLNYSPICKTYEYGFIDLVKKKFTNLKNFKKFTERQFLLWEL
jgi:hypothetical protein